VRHDFANREGFSMTDNRYYNETTNTAGGIPTPPENENIGPFDSLNEWVEEMMDTIRRDVAGDEAADLRPDDRHPDGRT
jgi:hypothetical protein